ncbi:MAG: c-type cytochrome biogenesis protein CcmI [Casimicrobiaceae bacterium]
MPSAIVFWIVSALVVIVTLGVLLRALLAHRADDPPASDDAASVAIFRDQKRQLDGDLANGVIDASEHARMHDELAARLGVEVDHPAPVAPASPRARWIVAAALIVLLPVASGALYFTLGQPQAIDAARITAQARAPMTQAQVLAMVATLAQRMKTQPEDPRGWALLGRSYAALGRFDDAAKAYAEATQRAPGDAALLADYADALSMAQGSLQGMPTELTRRALAADPHDQKALALAAASASERNDFDEALNHWRALAADLPADGDAAREVAAVIADTLRKRDAARGASATRPATGDRTASASAQSRAAPAASAAAAGTRITGTLTLSPALAARVSPSDTVFIFARAVDGPRMPLAVLRTTVRDLPRDFVLDDSMAMAPGMTISSAHNVVVEARVSKSGNAQPASGDLTGKSPPLPAGSTNIHIMIDTVIP